ncbi:hypothetical protein LCGC14_0484770 [marine sediment metagenome]|uniref:C1q domain-containing protein n=1 Tax=marine sediment metagenome TaxID=412755 RepID=A0A0F9SDI5_9ZZZZ
MRGKTVFYLILSTLLLVVLVSGDWVRPSGVSYGEMFVENNTITTVINNQGLFENITAGMTEGTLKRMDYADGMLTVLVPGMYDLSYTLSYSNSPNVEFETAPGVNSLNQTNCHTSRKIGAGGDVGDIAASCFVRLVANDQITIMIRNVINTQDVIVEEANLNLIRIDD